MQLLNSTVYHKYLKYLPALLTTHKLFENK